MTLRSVQGLLSSWWVAPKAVQRGTRTYAGGVDGTGRIRVAQIDHDATVPTQFATLATYEVDDHNAPALVMYADRVPLIFYSRHGADNQLRYRRGVFADSIADLEPEQAIAFTGDVTYAQAWRLGATDEVHVFVRDAGRYWSHTFTDDWADTWSTRRRVFDFGSGEQGYIITTPVAADPSRLRVALVGHPTLSAIHDIYYCEIELDTGAVKSLGGATLGNVRTGASLPISVPTLDVAHAAPTGRSSRLFDVSDGPVPAITYASWSTDTDADYRYGAYGAGTWSNELIVPAGAVFGFDIPTHYHGGTSFPLAASSPTVLLARESGGTWSVERWTKGAGGWASALLATDSTKKLIRPFPVVGGTSIPTLWHGITSYPDYTTFTGEELLGVQVGAAVGAGAASDHIEAWVTEPDGTVIAHLERSQASPFRKFTMSVEINAPGLGALEYHLDNEIVAEHDDLFAYGNLVWFRYRGKERVWIVEKRTTVLDAFEHATDWVKVSGRGVLQLLGDRTIWPTHYDDDNADPSQWGLGGWATKTDASAALGQKVVPVESTTAGDGATIGDPVEIVGGGNRQIGIIASIVAGVSVTLEDNLAFTFPTGSRIRSAASQWRRFVNRAAGEMLWDCIAESNPRFATQIVRGTIETSGADGWTQDFRFDNLLEVAGAVTDVHGDVEMDGLTFNYRRAMGVDRTTAVILEEGSDVLELDVEDDDGDSLSWVVAEGTGHAVFTYLAPKKKLTRAQRRTAAKRAAKSRRKAPAAPRKVIEVKADYAIDLASEAVAIKRRREGFLDAKDVSNLVQLDTLADAALEEHQITEAVGLQLDEARYQVDVHYGLADWVRAIAPSRDFDEDVRIVAMTFGEGDDEKVRVVIEVNTVRQDHDLRAKARARDTRHSLGVQNRQPQGNLTFAAIVDTVYFDSTTDSVTGLWIPDRVRRTIECRLAIDFDQYPMPVSAAASSGTLTSDSGGGSTSGASSASSSSDDGIHQHLMFQFVDSTPPALTKREFTVGGDAFMIAAIETDDASSMLTGAATAHSHPIPHTHTTPAHQHTVPGHTHSLTAAATKEAYPASHSVTLKVYELDAGAWVLRGTIGGLTDDDEEVDLLPYIIGPGRWRIVLKSDVAQPNGGRIGAHLSGYLLGAIQAE